jgi:hypothetical protein
MFSEEKLDPAALFEVRTFDGRVFKVYADGRTSGFPSTEECGGVMVLNRFHQQAAAYARGGHSTLTKTDASGVGGAASTAPIS